ncbi:protein translocase subunit SecD [Shimazuella sp. AN120528]|uniref:protein translocase subunit SecD n=1 Tax=Shimazuella soli TaxID=1892854 RepID=UPI001F0F3E20|nr:protein translocase subunit SecD [Shimazuella soli]MCH5584132.1 protein translocase subunit SecD [Shimazuella soli]
MRVKRGKIVIFVLLTVIILGTVLSTTETIWGRITKGLDLQGGFEVLYQAAPHQKVNTDILSQTASAIRNRIDILGVTEPDITIEPPNRIRVQIAGVKDQKRARDIIGKPAQLTFRDPTGKKVLLKGTDLKPGSAKVGYDQNNQPLVEIQLTDAKKFEAITRKYIGQPMPIYLDENELSAPTIVQAIPGGRATISGQETVEKAQDLASLLNAGALPIKLTEVQSYAVDASLGEEALKDSLKAGAYAILAIFIFVIGYYRLPGLVAVITLIAYGYLVLLVFDALNMTLTLPGLAAFILGIGIAVDANIIMNERIREELRHGKSVRASVKTGSKRSFLTIIDSHVTTIVASLLLFYFGTAAVKGFSVSLMAGIIVSLLTAVALSRIMVNLLVQSNLMNKPSWFNVKEDEISDL